MTTIHLAVILCLFAGPNNQGAPRQQAVASASIPADTTTGSKSGPASAVPVTDPDYKIGSLDVLRVDVWKETEISRVVPVRPDGKISIPLLNDLQAAGLTTLQLSKTIADGLKEYITNPQVTVTVAEINSRRVYITGEVSHPGALTLLPHMTVLQALSSSGGFTLFAKIKDIYVLRNENGKKVPHPFNYKDVIKGKAQDQDIELQSGDVIVVP